MRGAALGVAVGLGLTLSGCAGAGGGGQGGEGPSVEEGGQLTFANWQWLEPGRGEQIWSAVGGYSEANPQVELVQQEIVRADYERTISTQIGSGQGPDVFIIPDTYFPELAASGALEPLDGVLDPADQERLNATNENFAVDGQQLALTWESVPFAFFWNENLLDEAGVEPPTSPEELVEAAQTVQDETGATGFAVRHQMNEETVWWLDFANWPYGFGGGWSDGEQLTIDSAENIEALTAYQEVYDSGAFAVGDDASTFRSRFAEGEVAMMIDNSSALLTMVADNETVTSEDIGASPLPFTTDGSTYAGFAIGINANSQNKELARDFVRWMFTQEGQAAMAEGLAPSLVGTDVEVPADFVEANPWVPTFHEQLPNATTAVIAGFETETPQIRTAILTQVARVLTEDVDPAEALAQAQADAEAAVE
ncbi:carbohydrate ABC transporter substrate-binding protein (CUT1 family) [Allonocardiopsis opalescens]|uniref:Carbohydrate ABC transporter substrate-binding protein (CUT1 family) n=2 Tax=Allonocardiopsis opalescens TaxID=1144618 RepID=A0A2T0QAH8_9ACTN|nr:carbohydrate ABC transporter substrate-binding protein (CUT1 family) [Allonocardiopsis opalescens]